MADTSRHNGRAPDRVFNLIGADGPDLASPSRAGPAQIAETAGMPQPPDPDFHPGRVSALFAMSREVRRSASDSMARARQLREQSRELVTSGHGARRASKLGRRDQPLAVRFDDQDIVPVVGGGPSAS